MTDSRQCKGWTKYHAQSWKGGHRHQVMLSSPPLPQADWPDVSDNPINSVKTEPNYEFDVEAIPVPISMEELNVFDKWGIKKKKSKRASGHI